MSPRGCESIPPLRRIDPIYGLMAPPLSLPVFRNEIKDLKASRANEVWVGDLTYVGTDEGFLFVSLLTDKVSRKIVGHHTHDTLEIQGPLRALEMALEELPAGAKPIHHTDRGCQYASREYVARLQASGILISMTKTNHCAEKAMAECVNGILKQEYGIGFGFKTKAQARKAVKRPECSDSKALCQTMPTA